jgi:hypothetical protein
MRDADTDARMSQAVQIAGAVAILAAFTTAQARIVNIRSWSYLCLNLVGALALAVSAGYEHQWGFLMLNSVWSAVAAAGLVARARRGVAEASRDRARAPGHDR